MKVYTYKYNITKQVVQSTVNPDLNRKIRELYHQPFEQKFNDLKEYIKELEEKKRVFQMFTDKIEKATEKEDSRNFALTETAWPCGQAVFVIFSTRSQTSTPVPVSYVLKQDIWTQF